MPEPLWTVIERCLSKDPDRRPSAENLARGLRTVAAGIGVHANSAQIAAADGVGALLAPDPAPTAVPETPGAADPTQVLPSNAGSYDPAAATSVLQQTSGPGGGQGPGGHADPTAVMPPVPQRPDGPPQPDGPHPWQSQLQAARDRNEQTQVQYLDPSQDPLRRRPQRQAPQQPPQRQQPPQHRQQPLQQQYPPQHQQHQPQRYQAPPQPQRQQYAPPQPQQPQQPAPREPRPPRQRSSNPMRIPGLGCLKGCLFTVVLLVIAGWLIWELTPLQDWVAQGKGYWEAIGDAIGTVTDWVSKIGETTGESGGTGGA
ncbi:hypothetical protein Smic_28690 [Streptomyces microflavus]|uniref:Uncharacterized protein n=1 Tax=Streptomyces microflavus TaxID=1919 RepID=A0A7J0CP88_STRMI|nr:hypothetical protein Smic_28690 [Streptomyces microflavus]